jgi:hypothetical protein
LRGLGFVGSLARRVTNPSIQRSERRGVDDVLARGQFHDMLEFMCEQRRQLITYAF